MKKWSEVKQEIKKPLGYKGYGHISHLPGSLVGSGDHMIEVGQARIATEKRRDQHDTIIVQEKLDGSNCCVAKINREIVPINRSGWDARHSTYPVHRIFAAYVEINHIRFNELLKEGERVCGEFLAVATGTRYDLPHEPFVVFDIFQGKDKRLLFGEVVTRLGFLDFITPRILHIGDSYPIHSALKDLIVSGHGALEETEGGVWRVERKDEVDFLCKYVKQGKINGKYLKENIYNCDITPYRKYLK